MAIDTSLSNPVPERLLQARLLRGLSGLDLAYKLDVSRQSVHQFERGINRPSMAILTRYQTELKLPSSFFTKPVYVAADSGAYYYRKLKQIRNAENRKLKATLLLTIDLYNDIKSFVATPAFNAILKDQETYTEDEIENIADELRVFWGLGKNPISNLVSLLENNGFVITKWNNFGKDSDGCTRLTSIINDEARAYTVVTNKNASSACRLRFSLAHELAHVILHSWANQEYIDDKRKYDRMEEEANYFAGAFLLPAEAFSGEVYTRTNVESYLALKNRWKVSIAAMIYRMKNLHLLSSSQYEYLQKQISFKRIRTVEPLDDRIQPESPMLFRSAIELMLENHVTTSEDILNIFSLPIEEVNQICAFSSGDSPFIVQTQQRPSLYIVS